MSSRPSPSGAAAQLGRALRARREAMPATRSQLAERLGYSVDRVRQVETGSYPPGVDYMARWVEVHGALDERLRSLWDGLLAEQQDRRGGISPDDAARLLAALAEPRRSDMTVVRHFGQVLDAQRQASRLLRPADLIEALAPSYDLMGWFRRDAKPLVRRELLRLRSQYAQFVGRMHHDAGNHTEACRWSDASLAAATQAGDGKLVAFTLARRASLAAAEGDHAQVIDLARAARAPAGLPAEITSLSLRCEAHGQALNLARLAAAYAGEGEEQRAGQVAATALAVARRTGAVRAAWQLRRAGLLDDAVHMLAAVGM